MANRFKNKDASWVCNWFFLLIRRDSIDHSEKLIRPEWFCGCTVTIKEELHHRANINWCIRAVYRGRSHRDRGACWTTLLLARSRPLRRAIWPHSPVPQWRPSGFSRRTRIPRSRKRCPYRPLEPRTPRLRLPALIRSLLNCSSTSRPVAKRETFMKE